MIFSGFFLMILFFALFIFAIEKAIDNDKKNKGGNYENLD